MRQCFVVVYACLPSLSSSLSSSFGLPVNRKTQEYRKPLINEITPQFTAFSYSNPYSSWPSQAKHSFINECLVHQHSAQMFQALAFHQHSNLFTVTNVPLVINSNDEPYIRFYTDAASQFL